MAKKYPWIKLRTDFFDSDLMDWIHEQENGTELIYIYLRLCMMAVNKEDGRIMRDLGAIEMPYDATKLASVIKSTPEAIKQAMNVFQKVGILKIEEDGAITVPGADDMVGNESESASRVRRYRNNKDSASTTKPLQSNAMCNESVTLQKTDEPLQCNEKCNGDVTLQKNNEPLHEPLHVTDDVTQNVTLEKEIRVRVRERDKSEKEEKKEEKKNNFDIFHAIDSLAYGQPLKDALKDWARMRRQIKAPLNDRALSLGLNELKKLAKDEETMVKIVNQSIYKCWKGFFSLRYDEGKKVAPDSGNRREQMKQAVDQGGWG